MPKAIDIACHILNELGPMTTMKLQKLVYYCQAWSLVWDDKPLFNDPIEAWANGPVVPNLYEAHRGKFKLGSGDLGNTCKKLNSTQIATIEAVLKFYGKKTSQWLSDLTHQEGPWRNARKGVPPGERSNKVITLAAMAEYYGSL